MQLHPQVDDVKNLNRSDGIIAGEYCGKQLLLFPEGENCFYDGLSLSHEIAMLLYKEINRLIDIRVKESREEIKDDEHKDNRAGPLPRAEVRKSGFFESLFGRKK